MENTESLNIEQTTSILIELNREKTYILADLQDLQGDKRKVTLDDAKGFLIGHWEDELEDNDPHFDRIEKADFKELDDMLAGIDYVLLETEEEYQELLEGMEQVRESM